MMHETLPDGVTIKTLPRRSPSTECNIAIPGGCCDNLRTQSQTNRIWIGLSTTRPDDMAVDDWRGMIRQAIARMDEARGQLLELLEEV